MALKRCPGTGVRELECLEMCTDVVVLCRTRLLYPNMVCELKTETRFCLLCSRFGGPY